MSPDVLEIGGAGSGRALLRVSRSVFAAIAFSIVNVRDTKRCTLWQHIKNAKSVFFLQTALLARPPVLPLIWPNSRARAYSLGLVALCVYTHYIYVSLEGPRLLKGKRPAGPPGTAAISIIIIIQQISWLAIKRRLFNGNVFVLPNVKWPKSKKARKLQSAVGDEWVLMKEREDPAALCLPAAYVKI